MQPTVWWRAPAVLAAVQRSTQTDLGPFDLATLAFAVGAGAGEPDRLALDLGLVEEFRGGGGAFLLRPTPALRQRVDAFLSPASATVEVLNGSATAGLAGQTADRLRTEGVRIGNIGNAPRVQRESTVEVAPGLRRAGLRVAGLLEIPPERVGEGVALPPGVDVRVTLGADR